MANGCNLIMKKAIKSYRRWDHINDLYSRRWEKFARNYFLTYLVQNNMYKKVFAKATLNIIRETAKAKSIFYNSAVFL